jgi:hypothetical protein
VSCRLAAALVGLALLATPVSLLAVPKTREFVRPAYSGAYEPQGVDERGLWMQIDEDERTFRDAPVILRDQALEDFVRSVLCKTVGFDRCAATRIYIVKDASFNASMAPNGLMQVNVGLLARLHSEAELAAVLGHEFAHFELRHTLQIFRKRRTGSDIAAWVALAGIAANRSTSDMQTNILATVQAFNRAQETEADLLSSAYIRSSPYRMVDAQVWTRIVAETDALRAERGQRKIRRYSPGLFDTHPTPLQRIAYLSKLDAEAGDEGEDGMDSYRLATKPLLGELFAGLIKSNEFGGTDYVIRSRGDAMGWDGQMLAIRAELYRLRGNPRDIVTAREFFAKAVTYPDAPPESWRGLGLTSLRLGEADPGRGALAEYLKRSPEAKDAAAMKLLLEK